MVAHCKRRLLAVVVQGRGVIGCQLVDHPVAKRQGPGLDAFRAGMPVQFAQVVGNAAGADQQDVFLAQLRQGLAHPFLQLRTHLAGE
ncbi:hypothetical protein D3C76_1061910 [compost metagenome]